MAYSDQTRSIRTSPICVAAATAISAVGICTALFFVTWRLIIDLHQYAFGTPMSSLGAVALMYIMVFGVVPVSAIVLAMCLDRCRPGWLAFLTFIAALATTFSFIASPTLRGLLPVGLLGQGTNSSERWYWGAIVQLATAFALLRCFPRCRARSS
jgi:hypothetical protein